MLRWYEEMSLFEPNNFFLSRHLHFPGGLLRYVGTFLTQFLYHPVPGVGIMILLWGIIIFLTSRAFSLKGKLYPLALLVPFFLLISVVQLDEAWLSMKSEGYLFSNTVGFIFTLLFCYFYRLARKNLIVGTSIAVVAVLGYFLAGYYALLAGFLCALICLFHSIRENCWKGYLSVGIIFLTILVVPQIYYTYVLGNTVDNQYLYLKGLPDLFMEDYDVYLWCPFVAATLILVLLAILSCFIDRLSAMVSRVAGSLALALVALSGVWAINAEPKSEQLRATVLMLRLMEKNNWRGILHVSSLLREPPNYTLLVIKNLAIVNLGGVAEDLSNRIPTKKDARHSETFSLSAFVKVPVNYYIGRTNQSYRWAMEHTVQYGKRVFFLKYMVKDALINGDIELARRYNDIIASTMFHKQWAADMQRYIDNPDLIKDNREFIDVMTMQELEEKRGE